MGDPEARARRECEARLARMRKSGSKAPMLFSYWDEIAEGGISRVHAILGTTGSGKSTLALLYLMHRYECDMDEVFKRIVWRPDAFLEAYRRGGDVLVWDDAGVWLRLLGKAPWDPLTTAITTIFDLGRLQVPLIIMTMVTDRDMPRALRYNSFIYRSRTRVWRIREPGRSVQRARAVTQFRREKSDWSQSYWDSSSEYVLNFYHFPRDSAIYNMYLEARRRYAVFFLDYALKRLEKSKLYELLREGASTES